LPIDGSNRADDRPGLGLAGARTPVLTCRALSHDRKLWLLALLGLVARAAFLVLEPTTHPIADERTWTNWAVENLVTDKVRFNPLRTRMIFYPPLYPYFIAAPYALFGSLEAVKWAQILVSALLVPAVGRVGGLFLGERAGLGAAAICAFYPDFIWFSVHFWSETLFLTLLWWAFERLLAADAGRSSAAALAAGVLWGLAILTRETGLYFTPLAALWLSWRPAAEAGRTRAAAYLLAVALVVLPWTHRNWALFGAFVPVSTAGGLNLYQGNAPLGRQEVYDRYEAVHGRVEQYRWARSMGIRAILDRQPLWIFEKLASEMPRFWEADSLALVHIKRGAYGDVRAPVAVAAWAVTVLPYLALLGLFVAGLAALEWERRAVLVLGFLIVYNLLHVATHGFARYRMPIVPIVFVVAAHACVLARQGRYPALSRRRRVIAAALAIVLVLCVSPSLLANFKDPAFGFADQQDGTRDEPR